MDQIPREFWIGSVVLMFGGGAVALAAIAVRERLLRSAVGPAERKKRVFLFRLTLVTLGVVSVGAVGFGYTYWNTAEERALTHRFLGHLRAGRYKKAYEMGSQRLKSRTTPDTLRSHVEATAPHILRSTDAIVMPMSRDNSTYCIQVSLRGGNVDRELVYVVLEEEKQAWKVDFVARERPPACVYVGHDRFH